jgi:hypothetical protein
MRKSIRKRPLLSNLCCIRVNILLGFAHMVNFIADDTN